MKSFITIALAVSIVLITACSRENVEGAFENMRQAACNSNYEMFFQYIDKQAVRNNFKNNILNNFTEGAGEEKLSERSQGIAPDYEDEIVPEHMRILWTKYENWLYMGKSSPLCKMEIISANTKSLTINMPGQPDSVWGFEQSDGKWKLVSIL